MAFFLKLKDLVVLKEKLKNTYAYQNSKALKLRLRGEIVIETTEDDLVYELVKYFEECIEKKNERRW